MLKHIAVKPTCRAADRPWGTRVTSLHGTQSQERRHADVLVHADKKTGTLAEMTICRTTSFLSNSNYHTANSWKKICRLEVGGTTVRFFPLSAWQ